MPYDNERNDEGKSLSPAPDSFFTQTYIDESLGRNKKIKKNDEEVAKDESTKKSCNQ